MRKRVADETIMLEVARFDRRVRLGGSLTEIGSRPSVRLSKGNVDFRLKRLQLRGVVQPAHIGYVLSDKFLSMLPQNFRTMDAKRQAFFIRAALAKMPAPERG